jgi:hypothetical protein
MIPGWRQEYLCLRLKASERLAMHDAVAVALEGRANAAGFLRARAFSAG